MKTFLEVCSYDRGERIMRTTDKRTDMSVYVGEEGEGGNAQWFNVALIADGFREWTLLVPPGVEVHVRNFGTPDSD